MTPQDRETIERAVHLLGAVQRFIELNPVSDYYVFYDETLCDGECLRGDCCVAQDELDRMLAAAGKVGK